MTTETRLTETIHTYNLTAKQYQDKCMQMDMYNDSYDSFCQLVEKKSASILDIGTGPGNITQYLLTQRPDFQVIGIDLAEKMVTLARENNPTAIFHVMDAREISTLDKKFDGIMCGFCAPYLSKEELKTLIHQASTLLHTNGIFYCSTMEDSDNKSGFETTSFSGNNRVYIYYHQADFLLDCFHQSGFDVLDVQRKKYPESDGSFLIDLIIIAKKR